MIKKMNNKGYMLVEIILAFAITFAIVYFMMDLVINLKNKNDDLMVSTLVQTDRTIITNKIMDYAIDEEKEFSCDLLEIGINDSSISYRGEVINIFNEYTRVDKSEFSCSNEFGKIRVVIPLEVKQLNKEDFDVVIDYKYDIGDMIPPSCSLTVDSSNVISASYEDLGDVSSGIKYYGWSSLLEGENETEINITGSGDYIYYVVDNSGNQGQCSMIIEETKTVTSDQEYCAYTEDSGGCFYYSNATPITEYTGECTCRDPSIGLGYTFGYCNSSGCVCPSGFVIRTSSCSTKVTGYKCSSGILVNSYCKRYTSYSSKTVTSITCDDGYTKINDSYCYKIG